MRRVLSALARARPLLREMLHPAGIPGRGPDIIGVGAAEGMRFEITVATPRSIAEHLARPYGEDIIIILYERPSEFVVFPPPP